MIRGMSRRQLTALILGTYLIVMVALTIPATAFLIDRGMPVVIAIPLGFLLAQVAVIGLLIPVRIYVALRAAHRDHRPN